MGGISLQSTISGNIDEVIGKYAVIILISITLNINFDIMRYNNCRAILSRDYHSITDINNHYGDIWGDLYASS